MLLRTAKAYNLEIFDRNYNPDKSIRSDFEFPEEFDAHVIGSLPYHELVKKYKEYKVFLNVNSIIDSKTMFSRRVFELLACGTPVISTPALGIEETFGKDLVWTVNNEKEAEEALNTLIHDEKEWRRRSLGGIRTVFDHHLYTHRVETIDHTLFGTNNHLSKTCLAFATIESEDELRSFSDILSRQVIPNGSVQGIALTQNKKILQHHTDNITIIYSQKKTWIEQMENLITQKGMDYVTVLSATSVYGKHFLNDAMIAMTYSHAPFCAKTTNDKDLYDFDSNIYPNSTVCRVALLPDEKDSMKKACQLLLNGKNDFGEQSIFCADSANFYYSKKLLTAKEQQSILKKIEV
jgi:hypothetical protein